MTNVGTFVQTYSNSRMLNSRGQLSTLKVHQGAPEAKLDNIRRFIQLYYFFFFLVSQNIAFSHTLASSSPYFFSRKKNLRTN